MTTILGAVTRVTDSHFPGWVEIVFTQPDGTRSRRRTRSLFSASVSGRTPPCLRTSTA